MSKPVQGSLDFALTGTVVPIPVALENDGYISGEQPAAEHFNYILNLLGKWSKYTENLEILESLTWFLAQAFKKGISLGVDFTATELEAISPRLIVDPVSSAVADYTCVTKFNDFRLWQSATVAKQTVLTVNATRTTDGTDKWDKITTTLPAFALFVARTGLHVCMMPATQDTPWLSAFVEGNGVVSGWGRLAFFSTIQDTQTDSEQDQAIFNHTVNGTSERKLLWAILNTVSGAPVRVYYVSSGGETTLSQGIEVTVNAEWDNSSNLWRHSETLSCARYLFGSREFLVQRKDSAASGTTFADTAFTSNALILELPVNTSTANDHTKASLVNATIAITGTLALDLNDANPPSQTAQANKIGCRNVDKVEASFATGAVPVLFSGYNLATPTPITTNATSCTLFFNTPFADAFYECCITLELNDTGNFHTPQILSKAAGSVTFAIAKHIVTTNAVDLIAPNAIVIGVNVKISGRQVT